MHLSEKNVKKVYGPTIFGPQKIDFCLRTAKLSAQKHKKKVRKIFKKCVKKCGKKHSKIGPPLCFIIFVIFLRRRVNFGQGLVFLFVPTPVAQGGKKLFLAKLHDRIGPILGGTGLMSGVVYIYI